MKKYFCMLLCTILMSSCVFTKVKLSGHVSEQRTLVTEFTRLQVSSAINGASHMDVHSDGIIGCSVSGASSITYSGTADASRTSCSGASSISHN